MPRNQRVVQLTAREADRAMKPKLQIAKPEPPSNLWDAMDKIEATDHQPRFDGFTAEQYAERYELPLATAQSRLARMVKQGTLEIGWKRYKSWARVYRPI